jgi:hypothetical protein
MKKALFLLQTIINPWSPPFKKRVEAKEVWIEEGGSFDSMEKVDGNIFRLLKCDSDKCLVRFSEKFTLKGHEHPRSREVWIGKKPVDFTYLWGNEGTTKRLSVKSIALE